MGPNIPFQTQPTYQNYGYNTPTFNAQNIQQGQSVQNSISPTSQIVWVIGEAGANAHPVVPGNRVALFDSTAPVVYFKEIGFDGKPKELEVYDMVLREAPTKDSVKQVDLSNYITREELADLVASTTKTEVEKAISEISLKPTKKSKKGDDE